MPDLAIRPEFLDSVGVSGTEEMDIAAGDDEDFDIAADPDDASEGEVENAEEDYFLKAYCDFMNRMCHFKYVPHSTMQTIAMEFHEHSLKAMEEREKVLRSSLRDEKKRLKRLLKRFFMMINC